MIDDNKIKRILMRYDEVMASISDPAVMADKDRYLNFSIELGELENKKRVINEYLSNEQMIVDCEEILANETDTELIQIATEELKQAKEQKEQLEHNVMIILAPSDINDERNVFVEIRAGAGGEEAALFAATLFKMYSSYAQNHGFSVNLIDSNATELGGFKEIVFEIEGKGVYSRFKYESGVHRVQRVPVTESGGRIHTSTATVAILPEATKSEVVVRPEDLRIDTYRASGAGGQHVNRTDSAIRITHLPTGIVVQCQDERSQYKNKDKAMAVLLSRLKEKSDSENKSSLDDKRKNQVGTGDRSEKIRTYNYHQGRVSDHRIGLTLYKLEQILNGDLDEIIDALIIASVSDEIVDMKE